MKPPIREFRKSIFGDALIRIVECDRDTWSIVRQPAVIRRWKYPGFTLEFTHLAREPGSEAIGHSVIIQNDELLAMWLAKHANEHLAGKVA